MQFHYLAINSENKQLSGNIHADNEEAARKELNKLGFSVLSVNEIKGTLAQTDAKLNKYKFSAIDSSGKKIIGTINSKDTKHAYVRLIQEYHFKVESIADAKAPQHPEDLTELAQYLESISAENNSASSEAKLSAETNAQNAVQTNLKQEIDKIIKNTNEILTKYNSSFTSEGKKKINEFTNTLTRIKGSYNLNYLKQTAKELLNMLTDESTLKPDPANKENHNKISLESQRMLLNLNQIAATESPDLSALIIGKKEKPTKETQPEIPEKKLIKEDNKQNKDDFDIGKELKENTQKIKNDIFLWLKSSKENKQVLKQEIKELLQNRKKLKKQLRLYGQKPEKEFLETQIEKKSIWQEFYYFSGWLLLFYLLYYFITYYLITKEINLPIISNIKLPNPYNSSIIRNITIFLFMTHCLMSIQKNLLNSKSKYLWTGAFLGLIFTILIISNL
ncbi:hypothetical protein A2335_03870 [Candidatus Peregrinibacteria bacterium RIFOXYB2_FULL_32_7]|nr:MAG: hypothetical protein A2335_03870 [Candidatus Peregrinibacteria bacterium RIFOXYB2_FULL_32_7]